MKKSRSKASPSAALWKWGIRLGVLLFGFLLFPAAQVLWVGLFPPPTTGTMLQRWVEAVVQRDPEPPLGLNWTEERGVPAEFFRAVWVSEDQRFFNHDGFDWVEMKIIREEIMAGRGASRGASTITMQTARTLFLWQGRSWLRKFLEAYYTVWMELLLSKERILLLYANCVELGPGVHGISAAAMHYFSVPPAKLSSKQCVLLAAVLPNPLQWSPINPDERVRARAARIERRMKSANYPPELLAIGDSRSTTRISR